MNSEQLKQVASLFQKIKNLSFKEQGFPPETLVLTKPKLFIE